MLKRDRVGRDVLLHSVLPRLVCVTLRRTVQIILRYKIDVSQVKTLPGFYSGWNSCQLSLVERDGEPDQSLWKGRRCKCKEE